MKYLFLVSFTLLFFEPVRSQKLNSMVSAKVINGEVIQDSSCYHFFLVSFVNNSIKKIYIPDIKNILLIDTCLGALSVKKNDTPYVHYPDFFYDRGPDIAIGYRKNPFPLFKLKSNQGFIHACNRKIAEQYSSHFKDFNKRLLYSLTYNCLYLEPNEEKRGVFLIKIKAHNPDIFSKPGHYKIFYKPMLDSSHADDYPDEIMGYKKFIPKEINSNVIYVDVVK